MSFPFFRFVRDLLWINCDHIPARYSKISKNLSDLQRKIKSINQDLAKDTKIKSNIKLIIKNGVETSNQDFFIEKIALENINEISEKEQGQSLKAAVSKITADIINFIVLTNEDLEKIAKKENKKEEYYVNEILNFLKLKGYPFLKNGMKNLEKDKENILTLESENGDLTVSVVQTPVERTLGRILENKKPVLLMGMSATANYETTINNFKIENIGNKNQILFNIPTQIAKAIKKNYQEKNNYEIEGSRVNEIVEVVGKELIEIEDKKELEKKILKEEENTLKKLEKIIKDKKQTELIKKELKAAINKAQIYTLKGILSINDVLIDARKKQIKNMILFSTNSYQEDCHRMLIKYIHLLRLIEEGLINKEEEIYNTLSKEILFINASSFNDKESIQKKINEWENCYIITSYSATSRGVNLMYSIKEKDLTKGLIQKIDKEKENPKIGEKMDIQAIYLQKPTFIIPKIPTGSNKMNDKKRLEVIDILFRLYQSKSINEKELEYWLNTEIGIPNRHGVKCTYPASSPDSKIAALKTAMQAIGRRTRTPYRFKNCYTYIDYDFLTDYQWEITPNYSTLSESKQAEKIIETKKAL